ncbi:hypothetical protein BGZ98_008883 [Dissophora globulifera]|nr:hypothetical protein BGZ98_008883 [Dissophora globulifera]
MSFATRKSPPSSPTSKAAIRSRSPPLAPLPALSTTIPGLTAFDRAVHVVNVSNTGATQGYHDSHAGSNDKVVFTPEDQLLLYGAYKQATKGDIKGIKPTFFDIAARSKWQAWSNMRGRAQEDAREIYVDIVIKSLTKPGSHPDHHALADEILQRPRTPPLSFATIASSSPLNTDKDLPPIILDSSSSSSNTLAQRHLRTRKGSISGQSIRSTVAGSLYSEAPSVYELARESLADDESEEQSNTAVSHNSDSGYREITETVVEEELLDDDEYAAEVQKATASHMRSALLKTDAHPYKDEDEDKDDEVYQSSVEYDDSDHDESSNIRHSSPRPRSDSHQERPSIQPVTVTGHQQSPPAQADRWERDDLVDEGVFEEEEKDEQEAHIDGFLEPLEFETTDLSAEIEIKHTAARVSRDGSMSSGYGGSVLSDKESTPQKTLDMLLSQDHTAKQHGSLSPVVAPYRVNALYDTAAAPLSLEPSAVEGRQEPKGAHLQDSKITAPHATVPSPESLSAESSFAGEPVCPVSKKSASSGGVCPAAAFAQARADAAATTAAKAQEEPGIDVHSSSDGNVSTPSSPVIATRCAVTEPVIISPATSAVTAPTSQGKRIGQGIGQNIVSRFSALRDSLTAASSRAASLALPGGGSSSSTPAVDPNAMVVRDPVTNQMVTVVCPHVASTKLLETEIVRLQTDISVLHERLDLLQESLKIKSQTQELERRSPRGIIKLVLRQGLINAVLLLMVFAVLYKRRSPIAFVILEYVGEGRREGEAGWRAFMRWCASLVRTGQRNQQHLLRAGRRNGYW